MTMRTDVVRSISAILAAAFFIHHPLVETASASHSPQLPVVAVMPFEIHGLSEDESGLLRSEFLKSLRSATRFEIMSDDTMWSILKEANMTNLDQCTYSHCIADIGKVLGVQRVFHISVTKRGKLYTVRARVISSSSSDILFDTNREHSGEFEPLLSSVLPEMAQEMQEAKTASWRQYKWYVVAGAVVVLGTAMYFISKSISRSAGGEVPNQPNPDPIN